MKSKAQRWRRTIAGIGLVLAVAGLAHSGLSGRAADIAIEVTVPANTTQVELQLLGRNQTERLAFFRGRHDGSGAARWPVSIARGDYDLTATLEVGEELRHERRAITIAGDGTIRVNLRDRDSSR